MYTEILGFEIFDILRFLLPYFNLVLGIVGRFYSEHI